MAPVRSRRVEGGTAVISRSSGPSRAAAPTRTQSSISRPLQHPQKKAKFTKSQEKDDSSGLCYEILFQIQKWRCWICVSCLELCVWLSLLFVWLAEPGLMVSSELVASVQSLVNVLQQQIISNSHQDATDTQEARLTQNLPKENVITYFISSWRFSKMRILQ